MKRCKAITSRACDAIECGLLAEHDGAHEGMRDAMTRAVWTNPDAPEYLPLDDATMVTREQHEVESNATVAAFDALTDRQGTTPPPNVNYCACGTEHNQTADATLRTPGGMPLMAWNDDAGEVSHVFRWPKICRACGAVYCQIVSAL